MYKIVIEKECGCFKKSGIENNMTFDDKADAIMKAKVLECKMNQDFCFKHYFEAVDHGDEIRIHSSLRPDHEEEGQELKELLTKGPECVHFDAKANPEDSN